MEYTAMDNTLLYLFLVLLLVASNGFFVAAEFSLVSVRRSRIVPQRIRRVRIEKVGPTA
jgi:hypothetical protein